MKINFILNNNEVNVEVDPGKPLLRVLKDDLDVKSVKEGCGRGECGTCTLLLDDKPVVSCMIAVGQVARRTVTTLEGLLDLREMKLIQKAFVESGAVQCGFCTPGFIISAYSLLKENPSPTRQDIKLSISGNICRCTGYTKIIDGIEKAAELVSSSQGAVSS